ncbi:hypothetical protein GCM10020366_09270 [Saccharopolyspora gregorii]|uniref:Arabinofuranosyltransferase AftA N-terminal domain-containing protein n=1 Tax=Saccharopolyspora gregorii TaxID=33914 RepID=A0ABP6RIY7_9PSEU
MRLPLRSTVSELVAGSVVAAAVSLVLQFAAARLGISEPSFAPEALASLGAALVLLITFVLLAVGPTRLPRPVRLAGTWAALSTFTTLALAIPLQATRYYFGGSSTDNAFRLQYMTRAASTWGLSDMNYAGVAPYYPGGWFWLGGRFANLLGWEGWAAYKAYALIWVAVTSVVAFTLWSVVVRRRLALLAAIATSLAGMLHGIEEPYAWPSAAWLAPIAVLAWHALRREERAPRWTLVCVGGYVGFAAIHLHAALRLRGAADRGDGRGGRRVPGPPRRAGVADGPAHVLRLLPIGVVSGLISRCWCGCRTCWPRTCSPTTRAARRCTTCGGRFVLPVPMTDASPVGALCLAGSPGWCCARGAARSRRRC